MIKLFTDNKSSSLRKTLSRNTAKTKILIKSYESSTLNLYVSLMNTNIISFWTLIY